MDTSTLPTTWSRRQLKKEEREIPKKLRCFFAPLLLRVFQLSAMARSFAPSLSVLVPWLFLSLGSSLQLGLSVGTMAHSVSQENSPTLTYEYQVFVSFSEDTHKNFTCHLFVALDRKGIHVYRSEFIRIEQMKAIEKSRIAVVVFSKNYGNSDWCLDELVKIMECKRLFNQRVIPIFYDVSPSEVRKQEGDFAEALRNGPEDKVNSWKVALTYVASLAGSHLNPYR